mmetsp:Transcript_37184/g.58784  ORF Transcript_37184/g.58784 Transcript_37184/m.58784 type:complete len:111 (-) Transcript_37184:81-413(-)
MGANQSLVGPCCSEQLLETGDLQVAEQIAVDEFMPMELAQDSDLQKDRINPWAQLQEESSVMMQCCSAENTRAPHDIVADSMGAEVIVDSYSYRTDYGATRPKKMGHSLR